MPDLAPQPGVEIEGATRRPDGLYDCVLAGDYGPHKAGATLEGVDPGRARWIAENIKAAPTAQESMTETEQPASDVDLRRRALFKGGADG